MLKQATQILSHSCSLSLIPHDLKLNNLRSLWSYVIYGVCRVLSHTPRKIFIAQFPSLSSKLPPVSSTYRLFMSLTCPVHLKCPGLYSTVFFVTKLLHPHTHESVRKPWAVCLSYPRKCWLRRCVCLIHVVSRHTVSFRYVFAMTCEWALALIH